MNCATHPDLAAVAFCRTCDKPLCQNCTRDVRGIVYCEPCLAARLDATAPPAPGYVPPSTGYTPPASGFVPPAQAAYPPVGVPIPPARPSGGPNPALAGILGAIPFGVGAIYNGQYAKGLVHMFIFAMLIYGADHTGQLDWLFGVAIPFFIIYQIIDAIRTAQALQAGQPAPDPYGLAQSFSFGERGESKNIPAVAVILIGLGVLFLLHTMDIFEFGLDRFWPLILIFFGGWMLARQFGLMGSCRGCQCDHCRMRRITGPAILLTIGILYQLKTLNVVDFDRTWPAILLVIGIVKLLQSNASSAGHTGPFRVGSGTVMPPPQPPPSPAPGSTPPAASSEGEVRHV